MVSDFHIGTLFSKLRELTSTTMKSEVDYLQPFGTDDLRFGDTIGNLSSGHHCQLGRSHRAARVVLGHHGVEPVVGRVDLLHHQGYLSG